MATKLKNLVITKVALVDEGSCSAAHIKLYKRKEGGTVMSFEEILKSLTPEQQAVVKAAMNKAAVCPVCGKTGEECTCKADMDTMKACNSKLKKEKEDLEAEVNKAKNPAKEEDVLKGLDPAVRAILEKSRTQAAAAEAAVKKMKDDADTAEAITKAKELTNLGAEETKLAEVIKSLKGKDEKLAEDVFGILKAANTVIAKGAAFDTLGTTGATGGETVDLTKARDAAWDKIEKAADDIMKSANCSKEVAISKVMTTNPALYAEYVKTLD